MNCKVCNGEHIVRNGQREGKQCFLCKSCGHQFTNATKRDTTIETLLAVALHNQGFSTREIARKLCFDHTTIHRRLKNNSLTQNEILDKLRNVDHLECGCGQHRIALAEILS